MERTEKELQELKSKSTRNCKSIVEQTWAKPLINHAADTSALIGPVIYLSGTI